MRISQILVVEGANDTKHLQQFFDCDTIETGGSHITGELLERVAAAQKSRGVIVFTDPDSSGEHIRSILSRKIPGIQHAFIEKTKARTAKKVGVEHASKEDLEESLQHVVRFAPVPEQPSLSWAEFLDAGAVGNAARREDICKTFHIGKCNAKTCYKRLCQLGVDAQAMERAGFYD